MQILFNEQNLTQYELLLERYDLIGEKYYCEFTPTNGLIFHDIIVITNPDFLRENETALKPPKEILEKLFNDLNNNEPKIELPIIDGKEWSTELVDVYYGAVFIKDIASDGTFKASSINLWVTNIENSMVDVLQYYTMDELFGFVEWFDDDLYRFKYQYDDENNSIHIIQNRIEILERIIDKINRYKDINDVVIVKYVAELNKSLYGIRNSEEIIKIPILDYEL